MAGGDDGGLRRRLLGAGATWALAALVVVAAAHPEGCHPPSVAEAEAATEAAVGWLAVNQRDDGAFLYRYDRDRAEDLGGYNVVRHAGVLLALAQAEAAGVEGAGDSFRSGMGWVDERIVPVGDGAALAEGGTADTGATALLVAALVEWREATGDTDRDALLRDLGAFLADRVTEDGAVVALADVARGDDVAGSRSPFSTGEAAWALAALHTTFPAEGWDDPAREVLAYLAADRDDEERRFPPVSDHWSAYALAEVGAGWNMALTAAEQRLVRRQAGLFGLQARYESQRRDAGPVRWTRGPFALGAGVGTLGEGLGAVHRLAPFDTVAADLDAAVAERHRCVAGLLVDRQVTAAEAADQAEPERVRGAWFREGVTQMDDQQHALSALLAAVTVLGPDGRGEP
jgi:hypothetical protein